MHAPDVSIPKTEHVKKITLTNRNILLDIDPNDRMYMRWLWFTIDRSTHPAAAGAALAAGHPGDDEPEVVVPGRLVLSVGEEKKRRKGRGGCRYVNRL